MVENSEWYSRIYAIKFTFLINMQYCLILNREKDKKLVSLTNKAFVMVPSLYVKKREKQKIGP